MHRRNFIQALSLGLAGLYLNGIIKPQTANQNLGIQLYTVRDAIAINLERTLEHLALLGFTHVEIYGYNGKFFGKSATEFKTVLENTGLTVTSSHHPAGIASKDFGTLSKGWEKAVADVEILGAKYVVCSYLFPEERTPAIYKTLPAFLEKSGEFSKAAGIQLAYHNHDFEFEKFENTLFYDFLLQNTSADLVQMELDLYWITKAGYDPIGYFEKYPGRFPLWHVKDMDTITKDFAEIGNGIIDFDPIFAAREKSGLQHWFVEQDNSKYDIFESLKMSRNHIKSKKYWK